MSTPYEQRFLSCMALSVYEVASLLVAKLEAIDKRRERPRKRLKPCWRETSARRVNYVIPDHAEIFFVLISSRRMMSERKRWKKYFFRSWLLLSVGIIYLNTEMQFPCHIHV